MNWYAAAVSWRRKGLILPQQSLSLSLSPSHPPLPLLSIQCQDFLSLILKEMSSLIVNLCLPPLCTCRKVSPHANTHICSTSYNAPLLSLSQVPLRTTCGVWKKDEPNSWPGARVSFPLPVSLCPAPAQRQPLPLVVTRVHCWGWEQRTGKD